MEGGSGDVRGQEHEAHGESKRAMVDEASWGRGSRLREKPWVSSECVRCEVRGVRYDV